MYITHATQSLVHEERAQFTTKRCMSNTLSCQHRECSSNFLVGLISLRIRITLRHVFCCCRQSRGAVQKQMLPSRQLLSYRSKNEVDAPLQKHTETGNGTMWAGPCAFWYLLHAREITASGHLCLTWLRILLESLTHNENQAKQFPQATACLRMHPYGATSRLCKSGVTYLFQLQHTK